MLNKGSSIYVLSPIILICRKIIKQPLSGQVKILNYSPPNKLLVQWNIYWQGSWLLQDFLQKSAIISNKIYIKLLPPNKIYKIVERVNNVLPYVIYVIFGFTPCKIFFLDFVLVI